MATCLANLPSTTKATWLTQEPEMWCPQQQTQKLPPLLITNCSNQDCSTQVVTNERSGQFLLREYKRLVTSVAEERHGLKRKAHAQLSEGASNQGGAEGSVPADPSSSQAEDDWELQVEEQEEAADGDVADSSQEEDDRELLHLGRAGISDTSTLPWLDFDPHDLNALLSQWLTLMQQLPPSLQPCQELLATRMSDVPDLHAQLKHVCVALVRIRTHLTAMRSSFVAGMLQVAAKQATQHAQHRGSTAGASQWPEEFRQQEVWHGEQRLQQRTQGTWAALQAGAGALQGFSPSVQPLVFGPQHVILPPASILRTRHGHRQPHCLNACLPEQAVLVLAWRQRMRHNAEAFTAVAEQLQGLAASLNPGQLPAVPTPAYVSTLLDLGRAGTALIRLVGHCNRCWPQPGRLQASGSPAVDLASPPAVTWHSRDAGEHGGQPHDVVADQGLLGQPLGITQPVATFMAVPHLTPTGSHELGMGIGPVPDLLNENLYVLSQMMEDGEGDDDEEEGGEEGW